MPYEDDPQEAEFVRQRLAENWDVDDAIEAYKLQKGIESPSKKTPPVTPNSPSPNTLSNTSSSQEKKYHHPMAQIMQFLTDPQSLSPDKRELNAALSQGAAGLAPIAATLATGGAGIIPALMAGGAGWLAARNTHDTTDLPRQAVATGASMVPGALMAGKVPSGFLQSLLAGALSGVAGKAGEDATDAATSAMGMPSTSAQMEGPPSINKYLGSAGLGAVFGSLPWAVRTRKLQKTSDQIQGVQDSFDAIPSQQDFRGQLGGALQNRQTIPAEDNLKELADQVRNTVDSPEKRKMLAAIENKLVLNKAAKADQALELARSKMMNAKSVSDYKDAQSEYDDLQSQFKDHANSLKTVLKGNLNEQDKSVAQAMLNIAEARNKYIKDPKEIDPESNMPYERLYELIRGKEGVNIAAARLGKRMEQGDALQGEPPYASGEAPEAPAPPTLQDTTKLIFDKAKLDRQAKALQSKHDQVMKDFSIQMPANASREENAAGSAFFNRLGASGKNYRDIQITDVAKALKDAEPSEVAVVLKKYGNQSDNVKDFFIGNLLKDSIRYTGDKNTPLPVPDISNFGQAMTNSGLRNPNKLNTIFPNESDRNNFLKFTNGIEDALAEQAKSGDGLINRAIKAIPTSTGLRYLAIHFGVPGPLATAAAVGHAATKMSMDQPTTIPWEDLAQLSRDPKLADKLVKSIKSGAYVGGELGKELTDWLSTHGKKDNQNNSNSINVSDALDNLKQRGMYGQ